MIPELAAKAAPAAAARLPRRRRIIRAKKKERRPSINKPPITVPIAMPTLAPTESVVFWAVARLYFNVKRWVDITLTVGKDSRLTKVVGSELEDIDMDVAASL